jgi:hypothetical protein
VTHDLYSTLTLDELANDPGRTVMLPVEAIEALLARYAGGKPVGLAQDARPVPVGLLPRAGRFSGAAPILPPLGRLRQLMAPLTKMSPA